MFGIKHSDRNLQHHTNQQTDRQSRERQDRQSEFKLSDIKHLVRDHQHSENEQTDRQSLERKDRQSEYEFAGYFFHLDVWASQFSMTDDDILALSCSNTFEGDEIQKKGKKEFFRSKFWQLYLEEYFILKLELITSDLSQLCSYLNRKTSKHYLNWRAGKSFELIKWKK